MVDIETLGARPGSAIVAIGAVVFTAEAVVAEWECVVDPQSCVDAGLTLDVGTIKWWMAQSDAARAATFVADGVDIRQALYLLNTFSDGHDVASYWSHGATFDLVLLTEAALRCGESPLVRNFPLARDTRTLYEITGVNPRSFMGTGTAHNAVDDARAQALAVIESWRILRRWKSAAPNTGRARVFSPWRGVGA